MSFYYLRRKVTNHVALGASIVSACFGILILFWILKDVFILGLPAISIAFFTELPVPPGINGGGLANAIVGTFLITAVATILGVPAGILAGTYLSEYGRKSKFAATVRFVSDILVSAPSIVIGIFVYIMVVRPTGGFSALAGSAALAIIMLPVVVRTSEEILKLVPDATREAALALGAPHWKVTVSVVYRGAARGILTGVMLAVARVSGETAPLLFTSFNNSFWNFDLREPTASLTVTIFNYAMGPYEDWHSKAWGAALLITAVLLLVTLASKVIVRDKES